MEAKYLKCNKTLLIVKEIIIIRVYAKQDQNSEEGNVMLKLLELGMKWENDSRWYVRILGKAAMVMPVLKAKWIELHIEKE